MDATTKADRQRRNLEATAYHEAGHVVACIELGRPFKSVTIVPGDDSLGHISKTPVPASVMPDVDLSPKTERWIEREILCTLAGLAAEHRFTGRNNWRGARSDTSVAVDIASFIYPFGSRVLEKYMAFMIERARAFVSAPKNWLRIETLAAALLDRRTLSAGESKELCRRALFDAVPGRRLGSRCEELIQAQIEESERDDLDAAAELVPGEAAQMSAKRTSKRK